MQIRSLAIVVASLSLVTVGCATKKFVREEVSKSEAKLGADVGRVDASLTEEKARTTAINDELGQTKVAVQRADQDRHRGDQLSPRPLRAARTRVSPRRRRPRPAPTRLTRQPARPWPRPTRRALA